MSSFFSCYNSKLPSHEVLQHIHGYIDSFFSCRYCRDHYLAMAERRHLTSIKDEDDAILSFWSAHNEVNERLSVEAHDPYFPKVQYPPQSVCNSCRDENGQFDTDKVLQFLLKHYRRVKTKAGRIRYVTVAVDSRNKSSINSKNDKANRAERYLLLHEASPQTRYHAFDVLSYIVVCIMCVTLLIILLLVICKRKLRTFNAANVYNRLVPIH